MPFGFVAAIDLLGYKEKSRGKSAREMIDILGGIRKAAQGMLEEEDLARGYCLTIKDGVRREERGQTAFISDTFVITVVNGDREVVHLGNVDGISLLSTKIQIAAANAGFPSRGCIAFGEYEIEDNMIAGEAIFDCIELFEAAEEAVVFFTPSAYFAIQQGIEGELETMELHLGAGNMSQQEYDQIKAYLIECYGVYDLLLKTGATQLPVANPFQFLTSDDEKGEYEGKVLSELRKKNIRLYAKFRATKNLFDKLKERARNEAEVQALYERCMSSAVVTYSSSEDKGSSKVFATRRGQRTVSIPFLGESHAEGTESEKHEERD